MQFIYNLLLVLHFIGLASLLGGVIVQMKSSDKGVNPAMVHGALTQLVTGVLMVGIAESGGVDEELNMTKIAVKLIVVLIITVLAFAVPEVTLSAAYSVSPIWWPTSAVCRT